MSFERIEEFEKRFEQFRYKPDLANQFTDKEIVEYIQQVANSNLPYRSYPIYETLFKAFPSNIWQPPILSLLDNFPLMPQGVPYTSCNSYRALKMPDGSWSDETYNCFHPGIQLIQAAFETSPELFKDHLPALFINNISLYRAEEFTFWRKYGNNFIDFFSDYISQPLTEIQFAEAITKLLMCGGNELEIMATTCSKKHFSSTESQRLLNSFIIEVGMEWDGSSFRQLFPTKSLHLIFPFINKEEASYKAKAPLLGNYKWGGWKNFKRNGDKNIRLQHIITLDPIPPNLNIKSVAKLELTVNMDFANEDGTDVYYHYDTNGQLIFEEEGPWVYDEPGDYVTNESAFKACSVELSNQGPEYELQGWEMHENNNRIGGMPAFVQDFHYPKCCDCNKTMTFLMQLDSNLVMDNDKEYFWGSGGLGYFYWCDNCRAASLNWFCT